MIDTFAFSTQVLSNGVRNYGVISLEAAIQQMTQIPAETFGLVDRGTLKVGWNADLVIFNPSTVGSSKVYMKTDLPGNEPRVYADAFGIDHVFVNGAEVWNNDGHTGAAPGRVVGQRAA